MTQLGPIRVDCRGRRAGDVLTEVLPQCRTARAVGGTVLIEVDHLELLGDSITRLLKALGCLAREFGARIALLDPSGFGRAFDAALAGQAGFETR